MSNEAELQSELGKFRQDYQSLRDNLGEVLVGQNQAIDLTLTALLAGGHVLLEGPPGVGKTLLGRTLANLLEAEQQRIQFTSDLMPADILGTYVVMEVQGRRKFEFQRGPIFTNVLLADEINRATPKTQAALLEGLEERAVTVANETYELPSPFFTIATQSPGESEGAFPLPATQLDRFAFSVRMASPSESELDTILEKSTDPPTQIPPPVLPGKRVVEMAELVRQVSAASDVRRYAAKVTLATQPHSDSACEPAKRFLLQGAGPRAAQAMVLGGKVKAILDGRAHVSKEDIQSLAGPALQHRLVLNFEGHAHEAGVEGVVQQILDAAG